MPRAATNDSRDSTCGRNSKIKLSFVRILVAGVCLPKHSPFSWYCLLHQDTVSITCANRLLTLTRADMSCVKACLRDALALHAEALDAPVAAADGALHAMADDLRPQVLARIESGRPVCF